MVTVTICCQHCGSKDGSSATAMRPMESKDIVVKHVRSKVVRTLLQMGIRKNAVKKLSDPTRSGVVCEV